MTEKTNGVAPVRRTDAEPVASDDSVDPIRRKSKPSEKGDIPSAQKAEDAKIGAHLRRKAQNPDQADIEAPTEEAERELEENADARLRQFIERVERLEAEKADLMADVRGVYAEAKAVGFEPKIMRMLVRDRALEPSDRSERDSLYEIYKGAVGL